MMSRRLVDRFALAEHVEIKFQGHESWFAGQIVAHQHPGVWVALVRGGRYFVTNSARIRPKSIDNRTNKTSVTQTQDHS